MAELSLVRKKELRGGLIEFFSGIYPEDVLRESVMETFYEYYRTEHIDKELAYLVDKGYLSVRETTTPFGPSFEKVCRYKLTPAGKDLADGVTVDEAVYTRR